MARRWQGRTCCYAHGLIEPRKKEMKGTKGQVGTDLFIYLSWWLMGFTLLKELEVDDMQYVVMYSLACSFSQCLFCSRLTTNRIHNSFLQFFLVFARKDLLVLRTIMASTRKFEQWLEPNSIMLQALLGASCNKTRPLNVDFLLHPFTKVTWCCVTELKAAYKWMIRLGLLRKLREKAAKTQTMKQ